MDKLVELLRADGSEGHLFLCRHCYDLPYGSQHEDKLARLRRKADKIEKRIFADENSYQKAKGMHWRTFERLLDEYSDLDDRFEIGLLDTFTVLNERLEAQLKKHASR